MRIQTLKADNQNKVYQEQGCLESFLTYMVAYGKVIMSLTNHIFHIFKKLYNLPGCRQKRSVYKDQKRKWNIKPFFIKNWKHWINLRKLV